MPSQKVTKPHLVRVGDAQLVSHAAKMAGSTFTSITPLNTYQFPNIKIHQSLKKHICHSKPFNSSKKMKMGPKMSETVKGKLSLGARILQVGGLEKIFKQLFSFGEGEKLLKTCHCYLSTTAGPIAGLLFISSQKIAFCSDRSIKIPCANGDFLRVHYKVLVPLEKIKGVNQSENMKKPSQKYMEIVTVDGFDFWFMGFLNYQKAFKYLQQTISQRLDDLKVTL